MYSAYFSWRLVGLTDLLAAGLGVWLGFVGICLFGSVV